MPQSDFVDYYIENMTRLLKAINCESNQVVIKKLCEMMVKGKNIYLVASGNTLPVVLDLEFRLNRLGLNAFTSTLNERVLNYINNAPSNSIVIAVSKSGALKSIVKALELASKRGLQSVAISNEISSPIADHSEITIHSGDPYKNYPTYYLSGTDSHIGEQIIADLIIMQLKEYYIHSKDKDNEIKLMIDKY